MAVRRRGRGRAVPEDESDGGRAMPASGERTRTTGSVVVTIACSGIVWVVATWIHRYGLAGLALDRAAIRGWLDGDGLYAYRSPITRLGTAEPPVAAMLLAVGTALPLGLTGWLLALAGVAALILALIALVGPVARRYGKPRWPAVTIAVGLALIAEPVRLTLGFGRLDLLLFGLITADVVALRRGAWARSRAAWWPGRSASQPSRRMPGDLLRRGWATGAWAGVGTGIATVLAISPVLFIAYLFLTRQWRAACTALGTAAGLALCAFLIAPPATAAWFDSVLFAADRSGPVGTPANQSLAGVLARLYDSSSTPVVVWLSFAGLLVAVGLIRARSAHADGDEIAAFTLIGLTSAAVSPVSHTHELIWVLPAMLILLDAAARRRVTTRVWRPRSSRFPGSSRIPGLGAATAAAVVYLIFLVDPAWMAGWDAYAFAVIILLNALPWRPGVAPAFPINRWPRKPIPRTPAIPGPPAITGN